MSKGTPRITIRLNAELQQRVAAYQQAHGLPDTSAAIRALLLTQETAAPAATTTTAADALTWWDKHMRLYKAQKWYNDARAALADQV